MEGRKRFGSSDHAFGLKVSSGSRVPQIVDARVWMVDYELVDNVVERPSTATWIVEFEERSMHLVAKGLSKYRVVAVHRWFIGQWAIANWDSAPVQHIKRMVQQGTLTPGFDKHVRLRLT